jgi:hypothetical protein
MATLLAERRLIQVPKLAAWAFVIAIATAGTLLFRLYVHGPLDTDSPHAAMTAELDRRMHTCVTETLGMVGQDHPQLWLYKDVWNVCVYAIYGVDSLIDFDIRRDKLLRQELDERVLLWMVVSVTISGVILAGLQLLASYKLATLGQGDLAQTSQLTIEKGNLALKSSVTGLFILAFSLAFFVVYVKWIYQTQEVTIARPDVRPVSSGVISGKGELDATPEEPSGASAPGALTPGPSAQQQPSSPSTPDQRKPGNQPTRPSNRVPHRLPPQ